MKLEDLIYLAKYWVSWSQKIIPKREVLLSSGFTVYFVAQKFS